MIALLLALLLDPTPEPSPSLSPSPSASVSPTPTPVPLYVVHAPASWEAAPLPSASPGAVELLAMFVGPSIGDFRTNLNVIRDQLVNPDETIAARAKETSAAFVSMKDTVSASHAQRVCNGTRDGWYMETSGVFSGRRVSLVQTILLDGGFEYVATYTRPPGAPPDLAAVRALDTLCPFMGEP